MMKRLFRHFAASLLVLASACGRVPAPVTVGLEGEGAPEVLIAVRPSEFKEKIVKQLTDRYQKSAHITVIDIDALDEARLEDFDAMVVLGARMGFLMFSGEERRFLNRLRTPERAVMVMTAAVHDWKWDREDIDVITGASKPSYQASILARITRRLDEILQN